MQLPRYKKKKRLKHKVCQEPGCGKEFIGHPIAKYCEYHRNIANRTRKTKEYEAVDVKNFVFKHGFTEVTELELTCQLENCNNKYKVKIFPKQYIYPKYCMTHRNEYKRESFQKSPNPALSTP
jgi:hypothetical protein